MNRNFKELLMLLFSPTIVNVSKESKNKIPKIFQGLPIHLHVTDNIMGFQRTVF